MNHRLIGAPFATPVEMVEHFGAVQAQDYGGAKWAIAQRVRGATDASIEQALNDGTLLRTHVLRPTWHIVSPADIRWMLELTAPRIRAKMRYHLHELTDAAFKRSNAALERALRDGKHLTRPEAATVLARARVDASAPPRLNHFMIRAELDGIVCSGPRRGKQSTYALLADRTPNAKSLPRSEALAELAKRYFTSHGPATIQDFAWWSGLTIADATRGAESASDALDVETVDGRRWWLGTTVPSARLAQNTVRLLPNYDEYYIAYRDRSAILGHGWGPALTDNVMVVAGQLIGSWTRSVGPRRVVVHVKPMRRLTTAERKAIAAEVDRYGKFLGLPTEVTWDSPSPSISHRSSSTSTQSSAR